MKGIEKLELKIYTYKELCALFGEEEKSGNSKKAQLKEWERYFKWTNITSQKYSVEEIYKKPLPKQDGRKSNGGNSTSKFIALDDVIMEYYSKHEETSGTLGRLSVDIGILTEQYDEYRNAQYGIIQRGIPSYVVNNLFWNIQSCVIHAMRASLERLKKEGYLEVRSYMVLNLKTRQEEELSDSISNEIIIMENKTLNEMGIVRSDIILNEKMRKDFNEKMRTKIHEKYGYDICYYYKKYRIKATGEKYQNKSKESIDKLTRKFIKTIGNSMLKVNIPKTEDSELYDNTQLLRDTMELLNYFFVWMNSASWDKFWDDGELDIDNNIKEALFWTQYCLQKEADEWRNKEKVIDKTYEKEQLLSREHAIEELGEEVLLSEEIIPNLDWKKVLDSTEDSEYLKLCEAILDTYFKYKELLLYYKNSKVAKEYPLYMAHGVAEGKREEQMMTVNEFEEALGKSKVS